LLDSLLQEKRKGNKEILRQGRKQDH